MRRLHAHPWLTLAVLLAPLAASARSEGRVPKRYTIEQFLAGADAFGATFSADESRLLFTSNASGIFNAYSMPVSGGKPTALTSSTTDATYAVSYFPVDDRLLYRRAKAGNEAEHLYVRTLDGQEKDLTPGASLKARFLAFSKDARAFYVLTNERDARFFDLYRYASATLDRELIYENAQGLDVAAVSPDGRWLALVKANVPGDGDLYLQAVGGQLRHISAHKGMAEYDRPAFDTDSAWLYFRTNEGADWKRVRRTPVGGGEAEDVEQAPWDVEYTRFSHNGKYRITAVNEDGTSVLKVRDGYTGADLPRVRFPAGQILGLTISRSERLCAFFVVGSREPGALHVLDLATGRSTRLLVTLSKELDPADLVDARVVRFESFDGTTIPNVLYKPHQATAAQPAPAVVLVHGGPGGQTGSGWNALYQFLANQGYVVLGINNRGSSGYGRAFFTADDGRHGREPLWDCVSAKHYLQTLPFVDRDRIGIAGSSYGGYMVLAALAFTPDVFEVGVDLFGPSNWLRTLKAIPVDLESMRKSLYTEVGDPLKDEQRLRDTSPLFHADRIRKPLLVIQGANDPRVPKAESDDIVAAVKKLGVPVEYLVFADEGHGFSKRKNEIEAWGTMARFLDRYLKAAGQSGARPAKR